MDKIINSMEETFKINVNALEKLTSCLHTMNIAKRTILIESGKKDNNIYFIEKGIARSFNLIDGKELTSWFSREGQLIFSTNSFYGKTEGYETESVQVLENSLLYYMPISKINQLCLEEIDIANWLRVFHQNAFVEMERRLIMRLYLSAEERYKDFCSKNQDLFQRVNLGYIASYLGISHVTLCALRKSER